MGKSELHERWGGKRDKLKKKIKKINAAKI
jgi:hypothetical protein